MYEESIMRFGLVVFLDNILCYVFTFTGYFFLFFFAPTLLIRSYLSTPQILRKAASTKPTVGVLLCNNIVRIDRYGILSYAYYTLQATCCARIAYRSVLTNIKVF